jgi:DNA-binding SARP family transcriptional activator/tetratricopeptide (TPR) repeat protein
MDGLELRILGPLEVRCDGVPVPVPAARQRDLIVALGLRPGRLMTIEQLIDVLWGDDPPATARNTLHTLVRRLRRALAADPEQGARLLETRPGGYLLRLVPERLDAYRFETLLRHGRDALAAGALADATSTLHSALGLWRGTALADVSSEALLRVEQARLSELRLQATEELAEARLRGGDHAGLAAELHTLIAENPLRERPYGQLMVTLYRDGRQAEALAVYRTLRERLVEQLGVEPGQPSQRLHQAVLRGELALAAPDRPPVPAQLPADIAGFTGRTGELAALARLHTMDDPPTTVAIVGTAGVGKTALAIRWAHGIRERFPDGQLYLDLRGFSAAPAVSAIDALGQCLRALGVPAAQVPADPQEAAGRYRSLLADRRVLVVLDNARSAEQVRPLLPGGRGCLALVTSRNRLDSLVVHEGAFQLRVEPLPAGEAEALLARTIGRDRGAADPEAVAELARLCAQLPLALRIAAANLAAGRTGLPDYLRQLRAGRLDRLEIAGQERAAVRAAFDLSYAALTGSAQRLFRLLGCLPGVDLTAAAAAAVAGTDPRTVERVLDELAAAHLLFEPAQGRYDAHDLLRDYAGELAGELPRDQREAARHALIDWYGAMAGAAADLIHPGGVRAPRPEPRVAAQPGWDRPAQAAAWLDAERYNLVLVARDAADLGPPPAAWRLADSLRTCLVPRGHVAELLAVSRAGLAAAEAAGDPTARAAANLALGTAHLARQRYPAAVEVYARAAELAGIAGWTDGVAAARTNLATALQNAGRREEATEQYAAALALQERLGRPDRQAAILSNLGNTCWELGDLDRAVDHYSRALALFRTAASRVWQGIILNNLGATLQEQGRLDEALAVLTEALAINQEIGNRVSESATIMTLAAVHRDAGRDAAARELAETAVRLAVETNHRMAEATALSTRGTVHRQAGRLDQALADQRHALTVIRRATSPHYEADINVDLAATYQALGRPDLAASHASEALTIARTHDYRRIAERAAAILLAASPAPAARQPGSLP